MTDTRSSPATVAVRREWLAQVIATLQGPLPSGHIGDVVFLLRDQLQDILDKPQSVDVAQAGTNPHLEALLEIRLIANEPGDRRALVDKIYDIATMASRLPSTGAADSAFMMQEVLGFLNSIEGAGYGGMASFEIARGYARTLAIPSTEFPTPPIDNPLKAYTVDQLQYEIAMRAAMTSTPRGGGA